MITMRILDVVRIFSLAGQQLPQAISAEIPGGRAIDPSDGKCIVDDRDGANVIQGDTYVVFLQVDSIHKRYIAPSMEWFHVGIDGEVEPLSRRLSSQSSLHAQSISDLMSFLATH